MVLVREDPESSTSTAIAEYEYEYKKARKNMDWHSDYRLPITDYLLTHPSALTPTCLGGGSHW
jgi:hypothetical protein